LNAAYTKKRLIAIAGPNSELAIQWKMYLERAAANQVDSAGLGDFRDLLAAPLRNDEWSNFASLVDGVLGRPRDSLERGSSGNLLSHTHIYHINPTRERSQAGESPVDGRCYESR
jgi:hypothetical protein